MRCPSCNQDNIESNLFCIYCGIPLTAATGPKERDTGHEAAEIPPEELSLAELQKEVGRLNEEINEVYRTLSDHGIRPSTERPLRDPVERQPTTGRTYAGSRHGQPGANPFTPTVRPFASAGYPIAPVAYPFAPTAERRAPGSHQGRLGADPWRQLAGPYRRTGRSHRCRLLPQTRLR